MKFIPFFLFVFTFTIVQANGVGVINASTGVYAKMTASVITATVDNQVAIISAKQTFKNILATEQIIKYAFPLPEGASGLNLRWYLNGVWSTAVFSSTPQDTSLPGGGGTILQNLKTYLGATPLYFGIPDKLKKDSVLIVELTYVQLLTYKNGNVDFSYPNDYRLIQTVSVDSQYINFSINSQRTIDSVTSLNHSGAIIQNSGNLASIIWKKIEGLANANFQFRYTLRSTELGLFGLSTNLPDSLGYFAFIIEPNPNASVDILKKVFTLIIDRSGSMSGTKMIQAKNGASFIVNNLNEGDKFNLIDFDDIITSFRPKHVLFTAQTRDSALQYIAQVDARGMTNISGAFETAIPQFSFSADSTTANIIIFLTDGQATAGLINTQDILNKIQTLSITLERKVAIFAFGIGADVNTQLLSLISSQNNGVSEFLGNDELEKRITDFYLKIRNPVLVNTTMTLASNKVREVFPNPLPNLYKGEQMLVTGIYSQTPPIDLTLKGTAFGKPVTYNYSLTLSDTAIAKNQFLPKIWAKKKIENLLVKYYNLQIGSAQADSVKKQIIALSVSYGVISPFTSFSNPGNVQSVEGSSTKNQTNQPTTFRIDGNFPNPFNPSTTLRFTVASDVQKIVQIRIYNSLGQMVDELFVSVNGSGTYSIVWNAKTKFGILPSGAYVAVFDFGTTLLAHKMLLMK
ncbi:MAG: VWA domain-containing protein [Bacteroidota bacterium]|nr:VWA domain-containing protein [Bacteroidota bacterium]